MTDTLALENLFDAVTARFAAEGTNVPNKFGWTVPAQQTTTPRIAWVPGDLSGNLGELGTAKQPGRNPRPLATLFELFTCTISSFDATAPNDERKQYSATRLLYDAWYRAVYLAVHGTFKIKSVNWITEKKERRHGTALQVVCAIESMIPDEALAVAPTDTRAVIALAELDVEETLETAPEPPHARAATTGPITLAGEQEVDDEALVAGDTALAKDQPDPEDNGLYVVAAGAWVRTDDALVLGFFVHVEAGTVNGAAGFELTDVSPLTFERVSP